MASRKAMAGLTKVEYTAVPLDGGVPGVSATWTQYGDTKEGSFSVDESDPEVSTVNVEESSTPVLSIEKPGSKTLKWTCVNPSTTTITELMGGTYDSENGIYKAPRSVVKKEKALRLTLTSGHIVVFPRVSLIAKMAGSVTKDDVLAFDVTATVLAPTDGTSEVYDIIDPSE